MKCKKWLAMLLCIGMLVGMIPAMSFGAASAATLTSGYEGSTAIVGNLISGVNVNRGADTMIKFEPGFDLLNSSASWLYQYDWCKTLYDTYGAGYTCTNAAGYEVSVNEYGIVTAKSAAGNMKIPTGGFVLSGHGVYSTFLKEQVQIGDHIACRDSSGDSVDDQFDVFRSTEDSQYTEDVKACEIVKTSILKITEGGAGVTTGTNEWNNDVLVKATGNGADGVANHLGYVVKFGGNNIEVPAGYFALSFAGQTLHDTSAQAYNGSWLFEKYAAPGALVNIGSNEVFFRYDAAAAVRGAYLLTGLTNTGLSMPVDTVYDYSAATILNDAKANFELVDTSEMQALYNNMVEVTNILNNGGFTIKAQVEPYHATINQNYAAIKKLEFEQLPVEMRAVWIRPLPNDRVERSAAELDALLTEQILEQKNLGYNQIFVEAFYNSCTVFPVPSTAGFNGLYFSQNPYLVPTTMTCGSSGQPGLNSKLTEPYDMLQRFIDICEENKVEPHIWWEVFYVGYTRTDPVTYPDALFEYSVAQQILNNQTKYQYYLNEAHTGSYYYGAETDGAHQYFLNPGSTGARTFLINTFKYIWETYDVESFQLDYIRYPHTSSAKCFGYDDATLAAFHEKYPNNSTDLYSYNGFYDADWVQFRADYVTSFIEDVREAMAEVNPGIYLSSSPGADPDDSKKNLMQDITYWLTNDLIDILYPMAYGQNVPGMVAPGLVANNTAHFVCVGTSAGYDDDAYEQRWLKEVRDAGAAGIAAFGTIDSWVNYAWQETAVTPTGNAALAARTYLTETMKARVAKMVELGAINTSKQTQFNQAIDAADKAIRLYGIESSQANDAIVAIQNISNAVGGNVETATDRDVAFLLKIRSNSRDSAKEDRQLQVNDSDVSTNSTLTIGGVNVANDSDTAFVYTASTNTLFVKPTARFWPTLSGSMAAPVTVVADDDVDTLEFKNVTMTAENAALIENSGLTIELTGKNVIDGSIGSVSFFGTGSLYNGDTLVRMQGDVTGDNKLNTSDVKELLRHNVKVIALSDAKLALCDANGDETINTSDTRMFLKTALEA